MVKFAAELEAAGISSIVTADDLKKFQAQVRQNGLPEAWLSEDTALNSKLKDAILNFTLGTENDLSLPSVFTNSGNQEALKQEIESFTQFSKAKTESLRMDEPSRQETLTPQRLRSPTDNEFNFLH